MDQPASDFSLIYPVLFFAEILLLFFLLGSRLHFFLNYRIALGCGMLPGIAYLETFLNIWFLLPCSLALVNLPYRRLLPYRRIRIKSNVRMLPFRQLLDFCRYLFLVMALWGVLDTQRKDFVQIFTFLLFGNLFHFLIIKLHSRKEHVRIGLRILAGIFLLLAPAMFIFPINLVAAFAYVILSIWEAVYFGKIIEGYLLREQLIAGLLLMLGLFMNMIHFEYMASIATALIILTQVRILVYFYKNIRSILAILMLLTITCWSTVFLYQVRYTKGINLFKSTKDFEQPLLTKQHLFKLSEHSMEKPIVTNALPEDFQSECFANRVQGFNPSDFTLTMKIQWATLFPITNKVMLSTESTKAYSDEYSAKKLREHFKDSRYKQISFYSSNDRLEDNQPLSSAQLCFCEEISSYFEVSRNFEAAFHYYSLILEDEAVSAPVVRKAAQLAGSAGKLALQIDLLKKYISMSNDNISEKRLLIELLFLNEDYEESRDIALQLLRKDQGFELMYFQWLTRISKIDPQYIKPRRIYFMLRSYRPVSPTAEFEKNSLMLNLEQIIKLNPSFGILFQQELERQETIEFPD